ncbi:uncharacterized protein LOC105424236 [Pogonomyrmex barbatus]|uniref:Uncharacterized protein LOC105424236 n=1 Tax=Pogonomyrmex barbatus TaxID=144034 RepID=A0A6I9VWS5_9HYME|nr:uncharacterized protein LOC105424236 [Pogonomyrmex barbatus]
MSMLKFAEEFTRLIIRYKRTSSPIIQKDSSNIVTPLTDEQIIYAIRHVFNAISIKGFEEENDNNLLETVTTAMDTFAASTPEASITDKIKYELKINDTNRSQDNQSAVENNDLSSVEVPLKAIKKEADDNSFSKLQNEKKYISRSNPAIFVGNISRSDTFVREEVNEVNEDREEVFEDSTKAETDLSRNFFLQLSEIQKSVMDVVTKLNNLERLFLQSTKSSKQSTAKILQSPSHNNSQFSSHRTPNMNKTKISNNIRRSSTAFSVTPRFSRRLLSLDNGSISERRKSTGQIGSNDVTVGKSIKMDFNASPRSSSDYQPKFTKNPKYAHVQSTIPKVLSKKKKLQ